MALADIISKITSDAEEEAQRILAEAQTRADAIAAAAQVEAEEHRATALATAEAAARRDAARIVVSARLAARDEALEQRGKLVDEVLERSVERIAAAPPSEYASFLAHRVAGVARGGETLRLGRADVSSGPAVLEALRRLAPGLELESSSEPAAFERGAEIVGDRVRADLSLKAIVGEHRDDLELAVAAALFPEEG